MLERTRKTLQDA
jgi:hypothetical protein